MPLGRITPHRGRRPDIIITATTNDGSMGPCAGKIAVREQQCGRQAPGRQWQQGRRLPIGGRAPHPDCRGDAVAGYYGVDLSPLLDEPSRQSQAPRQNVSQPASDPWPDSPPVMLASTEDTWGARSSPKAAASISPQAGALSASHPDRLRPGPVCHGPLLLPGRQHCLHRSLLLSGHARQAGGPMATSPGLWSPTRWAAHVQRLLGISTKGAPATAG